MSTNELLAENEAEQGHVTKVLEFIETESDTGSKYRMLGLLPGAISRATVNGRVSDALEVLGAEGVHLHYQMLAVKILAENGKEEWLAGVLGTKEIPVTIGTRIVEALADAGHISALLKIASGKKEAPEEVRKMAENRIAIGYLEASAERKKRLTKEELLDIASFLSRKNNPVAREGMLLDGTGNMRPQRQKANGRGILKR